jgi:hypothetical protein
LDQSPCLRRTNRTSAQKTKHLPLPKLIRLTEVVAMGRGRYDRAIGLWLLSNYYVGLRPEEWWSTEWVGLRKLRVRNAKASQQRTFGSHRTLLLDEFTDEEMRVVHEFLAIVAQQDFCSFYHACRKRLLKLNRMLWPRAKRHITLYSGRHQFAADHKAARVSRVELAALMGHASTLTAGRHYARPMHGRRRVRVHASPEDVDRVLARNSTQTPAPEFRPQLPRWLVFSPPSPALRWYEPLGADVMTRPGSLVINTRRFWRGDQLRYVDLEMVRQNPDVRKDVKHPELLPLKPTPNGSHATKLSQLIAL